MIAVINYKAGNIFSITNALKNLGMKYTLTCDPQEILQAEKIIFPGQGRAEQAKTQLKKLGIWEILPNVKAPFLGICLGMQLLMTRSEEDDITCLNIIPGKVKKFTGHGGLKVPQMGWNRITITQDNDLFFDIKNESYFYFANSYYVATDSQYTLGTGQYGESFSGIVRKDNFYGMQFHPEKSGDIGMLLLKNFCELSTESYMDTPKISYSSSFPEISEIPEIISAIDLMSGKCVRLSQGNYERKTEYAGDPVKIAQTFERQGASVIHVVDLEGAKEGRLCNLKTTLQIARSVHIPVQTGGGIRTHEDAKMLLDNGVQRIIMSTSAIQNPKLIKKLVQDFGADRIIVSVDAKNGMVAIKGWRELSATSTLPFLRHITELGVTTIIFTDITQDGMLTGPNFERVAQVQKSGLNIIVAGGVSSLEDIEKLSKMKVFGIIVGKAVYEGKIDLEKICTYATAEKSRITDRKSQPTDVGASHNSRLAKRIIACMDINKGRVVKGTSYENLKDAGDPVELGKLYSDMGIDELIFLDITATVEKRKTLVELVQRISENINIPFTVGGGIKTIDDIRSVLFHGADKVAIESAAVTNPEFVKKAAKTFGSQCIVISLSPKKSNGKWEIFIKGGRKNTGIDAATFAKSMETLGAGELLVNSLDRDGTKKGYDIELLRTISENVSIPVIASSGAGKKEHFLEALTDGKCDAALAARLFHFRELEIPDVKNYLRSHFISLRS